MFISEILGTIHDGGVEICATADGKYDGAAERISVALAAFTRSVPSGGDGTHLPPSWLPPGEQVYEHLERGEADEFVKDVFHSWVKKVRGSIPETLPLRS